jgi:flagellar protein FliS
MIADPCKSYRRTAALTAPPGQIVLLLFGGAISCLERALVGFSYTDPAQFNMTIHNNLVRAQQFIRELDHALNMEQGGECAATLHRLYDYFDRRLTESNFRKRREGIDEVIGHLTELRDAWATMLNKTEGAAIQAPEDLFAAARA